MSQFASQTYHNQLQLLQSLNQMKNVSNREKAQLLGGDVGLMIMEGLKMSVDAASISNDKMISELGILLGYISYQDVQRGTILHLQPNHAYLLLQGKTNTIDTYSLPKLLSSPKTTALTNLKLLRIESAATKQYEDNLMAIEKEYLISFLNEKLFIEPYYIKKYQLYAYLKRERINKKQKLKLDRSFVYLVESGQILLISNYKHISNNIILTSGAVINQAAIIGGYQQHTIVFQSNATLLKISTQILRQLFDTNAEVQQKVIKLLCEFEQLRRNARSTHQSNLQHTLAIDTLQHFDGNLLNDDDDLIQRWRDNHQIKSNRCKGKQNNSAEVISKIYPINNIINNKIKIYQKSLKERINKISYSMYPLKTNKDIKIIQKKYHQQKVQHFKIQKRVQRQIKNYKTQLTYISPIQLENTLFNQNIRLEERKLCHQAVMEKKHFINTTQTHFNSTDKQKILNYTQHKLARLLPIQYRKSRVYSHNKQKILNTTDSQNRTKCKFRFTITQLHKDINESKTILKRCKNGKIRKFKIEKMIYD